MKFKTTPYHHDLLKDNERLSAFWHAISEYESNTDLAFDLGCGCGILSYFLSFYFKKVISVEINQKTYNCAKYNLNNFKNIKLINENALNYNFNQKADLIVCEMLDTALIDEEQIPVLNHAKNFLKKNGKIIPQGIFNSAELVNLKRHHIHWDEGSNYQSYSNSIIYSHFDFLDDINPNFKTHLNFKIKKTGIVNGLKLTTYTKLSDSIIAGPLPMLNPPLLIPLDEVHVNINDLINVELKYIMGNGIESIETKYL